MKAILVVVGILGAGFAGFQVEPTMRYALTGQAPQAKPSPDPAAPAPAAETPPASDPAPPPEPSAPVLEPVPAVVPEPEPEPEPAPPVAEPDTDPYGLGEPDGPMPEPEPAPAPPPPDRGSLIPPPPGAEPEPEPEPAPEPEPPKPEVNIAQIMAQHLREGGIKEFTLAQVSGWRAEPDEVIDGQTYQVGIVTYTADTIFGKKTLDAKALIQDGRVVKWVWPKSGMEIR